MRTLKLHLPDEALPTLDTYLQQTKAARVFRRAQAVREVVKGQRLHTVSDALHVPYAALRQGVHRFARHGVQGPTDPAHNLAGKWAANTHKLCPQGLNKSGG